MPKLQFYQQTKLSTEKQFSKKIMEATFGSKNWAGGDLGQEDDS